MAHQRKTLDAFKIDFWLIFQKTEKAKMITSCHYFMHLYVFAVLYSTPHAIIQCTHVYFPICSSVLCTLYCDVYSVLCAV